VIGKAGKAWNGQNIKSDGTTDGTRWVWGRVWHPHTRTRPFSSAPPPAPYPPPGTDHHQTRTRTGLPDPMGTHRTAGQQEIRDRGRGAARRCSLRRHRAEGARHDIVCFCRHRWSRAGARAHGDAGSRSGAATLASAGTSGAGERRCRLVGVGHRAVERELRGAGRSTRQRVGGGRGEGESESGGWSMRGWEGLVGLASRGIFRVRF
jgi:hypothetical protein